MNKTVEEIMALKNHATAQGLTVTKVIVGRRQLNDVRLAAMSLGIKVEHNPEIKERNVLFSDMLLIEDPQIDDIMMEALNNSTQEVTGVI